MTPSLRCTRAALLFLALLPSAARAQPSDLTPPRLVEAADAEYPDAERPGGVVSVLFRITIGADGTVTDAEVMEGVSEPIDAAARAAVLRHRFEPARRGGAPIPARIQFRYVFPPPVIPEPGVPDPPTVPALDEEPPTEPPDEPSTETVVEPEDEAGEPLGVTAEVRRDRAEELRRSSEAVHVVDVQAQHARARDLGDALAREQGVALRRSGGIGSSASFSLNGLQGDQIRFFLDGVPLEIAGYPFGVANVPVSLVSRVEIFRGVVPIRLGADALGGVVSLVTRDDFYRTGAGVAYQTGSFGTYRASLTARLHDASSGLYAALDLFADHSENDYSVDVEIPDARGRLQPATVRRFHDAYTAWGARLEVGFVRRPWARRLSLSLFVTEYDKELQHNVVMTVPYGEVTYGEHVLGGTLRYEQPELLGPNTAVEVVASLSHQQIDFRDVSEWVYDWNGRRVRQRRVPGEIQSDATDQSLFQWSFFGRAYARWTPAPEHELQLSVTPRFDTRTGDERLDGGPGTRDPLSAQRDLFRLVTGAAYQLRLFDDQLENVFFLKHYLLVSESEEQIPGGDFVRRDQDQHRFGVGDSFRYRFADWIWAKASYELATRLPNPDEIFGDGVLVLPNLELQPETSHNINVGLVIDWRSRELGRWRADLDLFARLSDQLIVMLGNDRIFRYQNVYGATGLGAELALGWTSPGEYVSVELNGTYQDVRNSSGDGTFGAFAGDRIPNRPWLFGNAALTLRWPDVGVRGAALSLSWDTRYVHEFYRGWESQGLREFKQVVDAQLVHGLALTYRLPNPVPVSATLELPNLTDERVFDFFGVQRPGRTLFLKLTAEL